MKLEIKKQALKISVTFFLALLLSLDASSPVLANWDCNSSSAEWLAGIIKTDAYKKATCIRDLTDCAASTTWGSACAVTCTDSAACGACECRCQAGKLYCADKWTDATYGVMGQTCYIEANSNLCVPVVEIVAPLNNGTFTVGDNIVFNGKATDPIGEGFSQYSWVIRTQANNAAKDYTHDITRATKDFNINSLSKDSYYSFFRAQSNNGAWTTWMYISFTVNPPTPICTGPAPAASSASIKCLNAETGLSIDTLWTNKGTKSTDCTGAKCEYYTPICGTANNTNVLAQPTTNLCSDNSTTATSWQDTVATDNIYNWTCGTAPCTANKTVNGACGTKNKNNDNNNPYPTAATLANWNTDSWCANGILPTANGSITLPAIGQTTANWICNGINGSTVNVTDCHASRAWYQCTTNPPVLDLLHASQCPGYNNNLELPENYSLLHSCSGGKKCEYVCVDKYVIKDDRCQCVHDASCNDKANLCAGKSCDQCDEATGEYKKVYGIKDCRDLNWREVAPN
jgi:hypothetical protein